MSFNFVSCYTTDTCGCCNAQICGDYSCEKEHSLVGTCADCDKMLCRNCVSQNRAKECGWSHFGYCDHDLLCPEHSEAKDPDN